MNGQTSALPCARVTSVIQSLIRQSSIKIIGTSNDIKRTWKAAKPKRGADNSLRPSARLISRSLNECIARLSDESSCVDLRDRTQRFRVVCSESAAKMPVWLAHAVLRRAVHITFHKSKPLHPLLIRIFTLCLFGFSAAPAHSRGGSPFFQPRSG